MTVLAQGIYRYWRDGALQDISEPWQWQRVGDHQVLRGQRCVAGQPLLDIEATYEGAECRQLRLRWGPHSAGEAQTLHYVCREPSLHWRREGDAADQTLPLPAGSLLFPLLRAAAGPLLLRLARAPATVVVPCLRDPADAARFLTPRLSERHAVLIDEDAATGRHYRYYGGEYGEAGSDYWLGADNRLLRYRWDSPQGVWEVRLEAGESAT